MAKKNQNKQPLTYQKAFKTVLPVLIGLLVFIVIGVTIALVNNAKGVNPKVTNGKETYISYDKLNLSKQEIYEAMKKDYGLAEVVRLFDNKIFEQEAKAVDKESTEFKDFVKDKLFGSIDEEKLTEDEIKEEKQKAWKNTIDASVINGTITQAQADSVATFSEATYDSEVYKTIAELYVLDFAKNEWAKKEFIKEYRASKELKDTDDLFTDDEIKAEFEKTNKDGATAIAIPFTSKEAAKKVMTKFGINASKLDTFKSGWLDVSYESEEEPKATDFKTQDEVVELFIEMYNYVLNYYINEDIIKADNYTKTLDETKTFEQIKNTLTTTVKSFGYVKASLQLPTVVKVEGYPEKQATITWTKKVVNGEETESVEVTAGLLTVEATEVDKLQEIAATVTFGEQTSDPIIYQIKTKVTEENDPVGNTEITSKAIHSYEFTLDNTMANNKAMFVFEGTDTAKLATETIKLKDFGYTITPVEISTTKEGAATGYHYLILKVSTNKAKAYDDATSEEKAEIKDKLEKALYSESYKLEKFVFEKRANNNIVFYDNLLEALYQYSYNSCYESLKLESYPEFKLNKKNNKTIVASIDGLKVTADDLFALLQPKYSAVVVSSLINRYVILKDNTLYNPWTNTIDKKYVKTAIEADLALPKYYFSANYFANYMGMYYFGVQTPNFKNSYGWKNFILDYYGASEDKALLLHPSVFGGSGRIYGEALRDYRDEAITYSDVKEALDKRTNEYKVDVLNLIIYTDYNYDTTADTMISASNQDKVTETNWTTVQQEKALELAQVIMNNYEKATDKDDDTILTKLNAVVKAYNEASYEVLIDEEHPADSLENLLAPFKKFGLEIMLQDSKFDYADSLVEEFHTSMKALWDKAASSTDGIENSTNYMYDQVSASGDFAFGSPYGYHAVVVTKFHNPTEKPTEAEFNLYREASVLESAKDSIKSVDEALANENVKTNRTLRSSYHAQKKLAELTIQKQVEAIKKLVGSEITVDTNYEMPKELKAKINRWIEEVHEHDEEGKETTPEETTCPDVEEHTASIVILKLMNKVKQDNEAGLIKAGNAEGMKFNQESFARYIQSVIDEYTTAE